MHHTELLLHLIPSCPPPDCLSISQTCTLDVTHLQLLCDPQRAMRCVVLLSLGRAVPVCS